ncbi:exonuclease domain-containing protein [Lactobacillaceae bacterium Melli_B3]
MNANTVFSVVDLETTGNSTHEDNRIIQFSCALVQNNKIIKVYSTDVNSETEIPTRITKLTGITNDEIKSAPTFKAIADKIYKLLSGTVFVAHNVNFDFPFLNHELKRVGHPTLQIKAIDTVTLCQLLLPMVPSFRLRDLTGYFNIEHAHPHDAASDAIATAHLFLVLVRRLKTLPVPTLKTLLGLQLQLPLQTGHLLQSIYQGEVHANRPLADHLMFKHGLVIRKFTRRNKSTDQNQYPFPFNDHQKMTEFDHQIKFIPEQVQLMNAIYDNYRQSLVDNLLVATDKGMGKKFGYGLPLAYLSHNRKQKVIVSLGNHDNAMDFINKTMPVIKQLTPFPVNYSILKSANNYIDLNRFFVTLKIASSSLQVQFIKAQILVWLTMTKSGDLSELNLNNHLPYFNEINHQGIKSIRPSQPFYRFDFLRRMRGLNKHSNFLITTHDYLLRHAKQISQQNQKPLLVIDNALELSNSVMRANRSTIELNHLNVLIRKLQATLQNTHNLSINDILGRQKQFKRSLHRFGRDLNTIVETLAPMQKRFATRFLSSKTLNGSDNHWSGWLPSGQLRDEHNFERKRLDTIKAKWKACFENANRIISGPNDGYSVKQQSVIDHFQSLVLAITREIRQYHNLISLLNERTDHLLISVQANQVHDFNNAWLTEELIDSEQNLFEQLFKYYPPALLIDKLSIDAPIKDFTFERLGLTVTNKRLLQFERREAPRQLPVVSDAPIINGHYDATIINYYADLIWQTLQSGPKKNYFIFNSKVLLRKVYFALTEQHVSERYNIMAEGLSGNQSKLIKNILNDGQLTVLGTIETLQVNRLIVKQFDSVLIADLPIMINDSERNQFILKQIKRNYPQVFHEFVLPNALLKLNQELALTNSDQFVGVLDSRLLRADSGKQLTHYLKQRYELMPTKQQRLSFTFANFFKNFLKK